jgi:hypothetical protein
LNLEAQWRAWARRAKVIPRPEKKARTPEKKNPAQPSAKRR